MRDKIQYYAELRQGKCKRSIGMPVAGTRPFKQPIIIIINNYVLYDYRFYDAILW